MTTWIYMDAFVSNWLCDHHKLGAPLKNFIYQVHVKENLTRLSIDCRSLDFQSHKLVVAGWRSMCYEHMDSHGCFSLHLIVWTRYSPLKYLRSRAQKDQHENVYTLWTFDANKKLFNVAKFKCASYQGVPNVNSSCFHEITKSRWISGHQSFFYWWIFAKFWLEKYDFDLYKGFLMEKMTQICKILKIFFSLSNRWILMISSSR